MPRGKLARQALGVTHNQIKQTRVLMVGAGGIGCELLKNLVLTGFGEIHIVDLDTIDLSNLNRQFLFRHEHIKRPKALVAKESAAKFNPQVKIEAHHANIKDAQFNIDFFASFAIVFNALDNLDARRHVNRMCLAADVPLIESGTTGFNGQVQVIRRGLTECYDCNPKETPKTFPVCTIRSTPSQPIHCIVWAKSYLFAEMFGTSEEDAPDLDTSKDVENAAEIEKLQVEAQALQRIRESMGSPDFARRLFDKVFNQDIERLRSMDDMWGTKKKPTPLDFDTLDLEASNVATDVAEKDQAVWTPAENLAVFKSSLRTLSTRLLASREDAQDGDLSAVLDFDKDDKDTLDFVAASANLRSLIFSIEAKSEFDIKQMAGNIIPAIATTNAMTAALCVLQSFHVLRQNYSRARMLFLVRSVDRAISSESLRAPNPHCSVCNVAHARIEVDLSRATLRDLVEGVLKARLAYTAELSVNIDGAGLTYDPDFEDNLDRPLAELGVKHDTFVTVVDEEDDEPRVNLVLAVKAAAVVPAVDGEQAALPVRLMEEFEIRKRPPKPAEVDEEAQANDAVAQNGHAIESGSKRKRGASEGQELQEETPKKRRTTINGSTREAQPNGGGLENGVEMTIHARDGASAVILDDNDDGAIVIE